MPALTKPLLLGRFSNQLVRQLVKHFACRKKLTAVFIICRHGFCHACYNKMIERNPLEAEILSTLQCARVLSAQASRKRTDVQLYNMLFFMNLDSHPSENGFLQIISIIIFITSVPHVLKFLTHQISISLCVPV